MLQIFRLPVKACGTYSPSFVSSLSCESLLLLRLILLLLIAKLVV